MKRALYLTLFAWALTACSASATVNPIAIRANELAAVIQVAGAPIYYAALGDSITYGAAAFQTCTPQAMVPISQTVCQRAQSYVALLSSHLALYRPVLVQNLGIPGETISGVISNEIPNLDSRATVVTLYIGTNDFYNMRTCSGDCSTEAAAFLTQYKSAISAIHAKAPNALVILANAPNRAYFPMWPGLNATAWRAGNAAINSLSPAYTIYNNACNSTSYEAVNLSPTDGLHPNNQGHANLAQGFWYALLSRGIPYRPTQAVPALFTTPTACAPYV